jgi:hypothetical protein
MKLRRYALAWLLLPLLAACGQDDDDGTGPDNSIDGTYALVEVNGSAPPVVVYTEQTDDGQVDVAVVGGEIVLNDGKYEMKLTLRLVQAAFEQTFRDTGTFTVSGSTITFDTNDPEVTETVAGTVNGNEIRFVASDPDFGEISVVFRK